MLWTGCLASSLLRLCSLEKTFLGIKWGATSTVLSSLNISKKSSKNPILRFSDTIPDAWITVIDISYGQVRNSRYFLVWRRWSMLSPSRNSRTFPPVPFTMLFWTPPPPLAHLSPIPSLLLGNDRNRRMNPTQKRRCPRGENFRVGVFFFSWNMSFFHSLS
jgi:hypothetical protein